MQPYTSIYHRDIREGARRSAAVVIPLILELVHPSSVIDVGCGLGTWLAAVRELGVDDVLGVDGDYVERKNLDIPLDRFVPANLQEPFRLDRRFDLVFSLEVAEHLPKHCAEIFVETLTSLGPVVLFSAAIPLQGGNHHINLQWQDYWAELFAQRGYVAVDCLRRRVWSNPDVDWWYAQNMLMYVERDCLASFPALQREYDLLGTAQLSLVHPAAYLDLRQRHELRQLPRRLRVRVGGLARSALAVAGRA